MSLITKTDLSMATRMLSHRLTDPTKLNVTLIDLALDTAAEMEEYFGRYIGYFDLRPNGDPCFVLMARLVPGSEIDHLFVFYLRTNYRKVQKSEVQTLQKRLPSLTKLKTAVVNIRTLAPRTCNLSILLQTVEFNISPSLLNDFRPVQIIYTDRGVRSVCFNPHIPYPDCISLSPASEANDVWKDIENLGLKVVHHNSDTLPKNVSADFDIMSLEYDGHLLYLIHHREIRSIVFLLSHYTQFKFQEDYQDYARQVTRSFGPGIKFAGVTRYFGDSTTMCTSSNVVKACLLARICGNNILTCIKPSDVNTIIRPRYMRELLEHVENTRRLSSSTPVLDADIVEQPYEEDDPNILEPICDLVITDVRFDGENGDPNVLSVTKDQISSQDTVIITEEEIRLELNLYARRDDFKKTLDGLVPVVPNLAPMNSMDGEALNDPEIFYQVLHINLMLWRRYTTYDLEGILYLDNTDFKVDLKHRHGRFWVLPVIPIPAPDTVCTPDTVLFIVDRQNKEYVYVNSLNDLRADTEQFKTIDDDVRSRCDELQEMKGWPLLLTSVFHRDYYKMHLIMTTFYLGRLFRYAVSLPKKLIYAEREFRHICHDVCLELQLTNQRYNLDHNLVKRNGYLKPEAFRSISSPVGFERSVVPSDQCPFCSTRGHKNLANHIRMKHGGQSAAANLVRHGKV